MKEKTFTITLYGTTETYPESERKKMMEQMLEGMVCCEGCERDRYTNVYIDLLDGCEHAHDEWR